MNALAVDPFFPDTLFAASAFGGVWVSRDGGATWRAARGFPSGSAFYPASVRSLAADPARPGEYYAGAADLGVFRSSNSGRLWKAEIQQGLTAGGEWAPLIHPAVPSTVYVIGAGGWLFRSADGGQSWERESNAPAWFDDVVLDPLHPEILYGFEITRDPVHPEEGYIGLSSRSNDGGATWTGGGRIADSLVFDMVAGKNMLLAVAVDGVRRSLDGGHTWSLVFEHDGVYGWLLADPASLTTFYFGNSFAGDVYRTRDRGRTWQGLGIDACSLAVAPSRPATLYAVTCGHPVHHLKRSRDGGASWTEVGAIPVEVRSVLVDPQAPATLYEALPSQGVWRSTDGGVTWTWVSASLNRVRRSGLMDSHNPITAHPAAPHTIYVTPGLGGAVRGAVRGLARSGG